MHELAWAAIILSGVMSYGLRHKLGKWEGPYWGITFFLFGIAVGLLVAGVR